MGCAGGDVVDGWDARLEDGWWDVVGVLWWMVWWMV